MLLMLIAFVTAIFAVVRLGRDLTPGQRVVLTLSFLAGVGWLIVSLVNGGWLGQANN
jgi:hypothetical protein